MTAKSIVLVPAGMSAPGFYSGDCTEIVEVVVPPPVLLVSLVGVVAIGLGTLPDPGVPCFPMELPPTALTGVTFWEDILVLYLYVSWLLMVCVMWISIVAYIRVAVR